jgi:hypothetical protein
MAGRSRPTIKKRQKELARLEKQREKAARRMQRKLEKQSPALHDSGVEEDDADREEPDVPSAPPPNN